MKPNRNVRIGVLLLLALTFGINACSDLAAPPLTALSRQADAGTPAVQGGEFHVVGRFTVTATVGGDLRPGGTIRLTAKARANLPARGYRLTVWAPEAALLRLHRFDVGNRLTGLAVPGEVTVQAPFANVGDERTVSTTLTIAEPGYYRVLVGVVTPNDGPVASDGESTVQNANYDEVWFTVTPSGGQITGTYDASVLPPGTMRQPGPFRAIQAVSAISGVESINPRDAVAGRSTLLTDPITFQIAYFNRDDLTYHPVVDARYRLVVTSGGSTTYTGQTSSNGELSATCAAGGATGLLDVWYESPGKASVIRHGTVGTLAYHGYVPVTLCGGYTAVAIDPALNGNAAAHVFANALITVDGSRALFPARGTIAYKVSSNWPDTYYNNNDDHIQIDTLVLWGSSGVFMVAHEYGHAVHHAVLGGIKQDSGVCTSHSYTGYYSYGCAYAEGFGDYHATVVRGAAGDFFEQTRDGIYQTADGATNEGGVAAFLYDLSDAASDEAWDAIQLPVSYVADIYRTCDYHGIYLGWQRASAIDHMIYCFEQTYDYNTALYFHNSDGYIDGEREQTTEPGSWSLTGVRNVWKHNLYNQ